MNDYNVDVAILGGGIAGLWLLSRLRSEGYSAALFETRSLGSQQTIASQGIIHGGFKYLFSNEKPGDVADTLRDMPTVWRNAFNGKGPVDLRQAKVNSEAFNICVPGKLMQQVLKRTTSFVTSDTVQYIRPKNWPKPLIDYGFKGGVLSVDEPVINVPSVVQTLSDLNKDYVYKISDVNGVRVKKDGISIYRDTDTNNAINVNASRVVFSAGASMAALITDAGLSETIHTQRRPLNMIILKGDLPELYAHFVTGSFRPVATITTHPLSQGKRIWYIGGSLAESAVGLGIGETQDLLSKTFKQLLPKLDVTKLAISGLSIDRGEPKTTTGFLPDDVAIKKSGNLLFCWPTKLALAPRLAEKVLKELKADSVMPKTPQTSLSMLLPRATVARPYWEI